MTDTVVIYQVRNPYIMTPQFFMDLMFKPQQDEFIDTTIKTLLGLKPIATLPTRYQISGNCSWANVEASVPALLLMLNFPNNVYYRSEIASQKQSIMDVYNDWVEWDKDRVLERFIVGFYRSGEMRRAAKAAILGSIVIQRSQPDHRGDVRRAKKIMPILAIPEFNYILTAYINTYSRDRAGNIGKQVTRLFNMCGVNLQNLTLNLPLHLAVKTNNILAVKYLLEHAQVEVNTQDGGGSTALMYAAWLGHAEIVRYLVEVKSADIRIQNAKGQYAWQYAVAGKHREIAQYLHL
jgi:ankyrin repeat protein